MTDRLWLLPVLVMLFWTAGPAVAQDTPFDRLIDRFRQGEIYHAQFEYQNIDSYTGDTTFRQGTMWVGRNRYRIESNSKIIVVDKQVSRVYNEKRNRVIISKYEPEEDDFAPSRFLNGVDSTYTVTGQEQVEGQTVITLNSEDPFALFVEVRLTLDPQGLPLEIYAEDHSENKTITRFLSGSFMPIREQIFSLDYPVSAEVIDMRTN